MNNISPIKVSSEAVPITPSTRKSIPEGALTFPTAQGSASAAPLQTRAITVNTPQEPRQPYTSKEAWLADYLPIDPPHMLPRKVSEELGKQQAKEMLKQSVNQPKETLFSVCTKPTWTAIKDHLEQLSTTPGDTKDLTVILLNALRQINREKQNCNPATLHPSFIVYIILTMHQIEVHRIHSLNTEVLPIVLIQTILEKLDSAKFIKKVQEETFSYLFDPQRKNPVNFDMFMMSMITKSCCNISKYITELQSQFPEETHSAENHRIQLISKFNRKKQEKTTQEQESLFRWLNENPHLLSDTILRTMQINKKATICTQDLVNLFRKQKRQLTDPNTIHDTLERNLEDLLKEEADKKPKKKVCQPKSTERDPTPPPTTRLQTTTKTSNPHSEKKGDPYSIHDPHFKGKLVSPPSPQRKSKKEVPFEPPKIPEFVVQLHPRVTRWSLPLSEIRQFTDTVAAETRQPRYTNMSDAQLADQVQRHDARIITELMTYASFRERYTMQQDNTFLIKAKKEEESYWGIWSIAIAPNGTLYHSFLQGQEEISTSIKTNQLVLNIEAFREAALNEPTPALSRNEQWETKADDVIKITRSYPNLPGNPSHTIQIAPIPTTGQ
ncbi:MAG: hypothetical protein RLZZ453_523 [Chlamydiota bacterium]|jgi:hypothetical protein